MSAETAEEYKARLIGYTKDQDPLTLQRATAGELSRLMNGVPEEALKRKPAPGKWSAVEILAHLAEDELTSSWRYRQMIERSGVELAGFDQSEWARLGDYNSWELTDALEMFRLLREANLRMLQRLTLEEWQREGMHAERGRITVADLARHMAGHDSANTCSFMRATVQLSLDLISLEDAVSAAEVALRAGVDWLEAGTPLILAEGTRAVRELRARHADVPIVADLKIMDGAYLEAQLVAKAGASMIVVMGQAHPESVELAVKAGHDFGMKVMGDNMNMPDPVDGAKRLEDLGCDYIVHHVGYDFRTFRRARGLIAATPLERLREVVNAVSIPVEAVGGLTVEEAIETPAYGAPMVVIGAPLAIDAHSFRSATGDLEGLLRLICHKVHSYGDVKSARGSSA